VHRSARTAPRASRQARHRACSRWTGYPSGRGRSSDRVRIATNPRGRRGEHGGHSSGQLHGPRCAIARALATLATHADPPPASNGTSVRQVHDASRAIARVLAGSGSAKCTGRAVQLHDCSRFSRRMPIRRRQATASRPPTARRQRCNWRSARGHRFGQLHGPRCASARPLASLATASPRPPTGAPEAAIAPTARVPIP
jgi:hypothetical protein